MNTLISLITLYNRLLYVVRIIPVIINTLISPYFLKPPKRFVPVVLSVVLMK